MKKIFFIFSIFLFSFPAFCAWWDGGAARMASLGGIDIVLPDSTNVIDLYSQGYTSSLVFRERQNIISLAGETDFIKQVEEGQYISHAFYFNSLDENSNYFIIWPDENSAVVFKPYYFNEYYNNGVGLPVGSSRNLAAGEVRYSRKFGDKISAGLMLRYSGSLENQDVMVGSLDSHGNYIFSAVNEAIQGYKLDFMLDSSVKINDNMILAVSGGINKPQLTYKKSLIDYILYDYTEEAYRWYDGKSGVKNISYISNYSYYTRGTNFNIGLQCGAEKKFSALFSAGMTAGYEFNQDQETSPGNHLIYNEKGIGVNAAVKCCAYVGNDMVLGISATGNMLDYAYKNGFGYSYFIPLPDSGRATYYDASFSLGAAYISGNFKVPVEIFGNFMNDYEYDRLYHKYGGVRGGVEWDATDWLTLRLGGDWPGIREFERGVQTKSIYEITGGFGLNLGMVRANLGAGYYARNESRDPDTWLFDSYSANCTSIFFDIKLAL
jgi:hypothetical protein